ncbi:LAFE_0F07954g1_1 [Lachancea fermentati]|uniref:LAFE_0F07954g1_1 n=1 Tax=Lachancea fermentati TaxID=4955 RepID=A0A1G4MFH3_LACFM|nr:LAFE_0F07954g1_1 [Lachancea fermentati]
MSTIDIHFSESVKEAVDLSLQQALPLLVYSSSGSDEWLKKWFSRELQRKIDGKCIALKLLKGTEEFQYFEQIFPSVTIPSVCCLTSGKITEVIDDVSNLEGNANRLMTALDCIRVTKASESRAKPLEDSSEKVKGTTPLTLKEQAAETAAKIYHEQLLKQRKIEKEERERIKRLVKADREEFKAKERERSVGTSGLDNIRDNIKHYDLLHTKSCILLIRLLNGHSISHKFPSNTTLNSVRKWVDENRTDNDDPYNFHRTIPRVTFTESDEIRTLEELELTPRSALILKPLDNEDRKHGIVDAQGPGLLGRVFNSLTSWWSKPQEFTEQPFDASAKSQSHSEDAPSPTSSKYVSPLHSPYMSHTDPNTSELSLPSRPVSPNVYSFSNSEDHQVDEERKTFNGNNVKLEDKKEDR